MYNIAYAKKELGSNVDFTKYTLNKEIGDYLNFLEESADNGTIIDVIYDAWNNDNMPEVCLNHPAPYLLLESFDEKYNGNMIISSGSVNYYILDRTVDDIISRAFGYEYHR